ncbi:MAG: DUF2934 domain-containing protein [Bdellovibrio bacteriovorus]
MRTAGKRVGVERGEAVGMEVTPAERHEMVAVAAYFRAEQRGFLPGHERQDWYEAAAIIDAMLEGMRKTGATRRDYERVGLRNALRLWTG